MTPDFAVAADGRDITAAVRGRLIRLELSDEVGAQSDTCRIELDDRGGAVEYPAPGAALEISLGWRGEGLAPMGRWVVDERGRSGPPDVLAIGATAADMSGPLRVPRTRDWNDASLSDVVGAMARTAGLEPRVDRALGAVVLPHLDQIDESDLSILAASRATSIWRPGPPAANSSWSPAKRRWPPPRRPRSAAARPPTTAPPSRRGRATRPSSPATATRPPPTRRPSARAGPAATSSACAASGPTPRRPATPPPPASAPSNAHGSPPKSPAAGLVTRLFLERLSGAPWQRRSSAPAA